VFDFDRECDCVLTESNSDVERKYFDQKVIGQNGRECDQNVNERHVEDDGRTHEFGLVVIHGDDEAERKTTFKI